MLSLHLLFTSGKALSFLVQFSAVDLATCNNRLVSLREGLLLKSTCQSFRISKSHVSPAMLEENNGLIPQEKTTEIANAG